MATLVLTVIGQDRAGLVNALADVVAAHDGNWQRSQLAELAGTFAGIVVVDVPDAAVTTFIDALQPLDGLEVAVRPGRDDEPQPARTVTIDLLGNDREGIVREVSGVLSNHAVSIDLLDTDTRDAPMSGGRLFQAHAVAVVPDDADLGGLRADLERLATELQVDITLSD